MNASPGEDLNLSAQEIATFNALQPTPAAITPAVRAALLARMQAYQTEGPRRHRALRAQQRHALARRGAPHDDQGLAALQRYVPAAYQMLLAYPNRSRPAPRRPSAGQQINAHDTPTYTLTHGAVRAGRQRLRRRAAHVLREHAASTPSRPIAALVPVQGGTVMVYGNRTSTDQVEGWGGGAKRSIGSKLLESQLEALAGKVGERGPVAGTLRIPRDLRHAA